eukprot:gene9924-12169_t
MKNLYTILILAITLCVVSTTSVPSWQLKEIVDNILSNCTSYGNGCFGSTWSVNSHVYFPDTDSFQDLYAYNENATLTPASSTKLLTTGAIYQLLGDNFQINTPFYTQTPYTPSSNEPIDYICVKGMGDPSLSMNSLIGAAQFFGKSASVGSIILDTSYYVGDPVPSSWEWEDLTSGYGAIPTPLIVDENTLTFYLQSGSNVGDKVTVKFNYPGQSQYLQIINTATTGCVLPMSSSPSRGYSIPVLDPETYFLTVFSNLLQEYGVKVGSIEIGTCSTSDPVSYTITSPTLASMLNYTLLNSDNLYAETFLRILGTMNNNPNLPPSTTPTYLRGLDSVTKIFSEIPTILYDQADGSGLSRVNFISVRALLEVAKDMFFKGDYYSFLPVGGKSGTLRNRFKNTPAQNIVYAKTGSMTGVFALTGAIVHGSLTNPTEPVVFFSFIVNNGDMNTDNYILPTMDEIIVTMAQLSFS